MARAFFRKAPIILLDEPTSFMDSWAEVEWFDKLRNLSSGRTTTDDLPLYDRMRADIIHVMDAGRLIESGTHKQLLDKNGLYSKSWREQMSASSAPIPSLVCEPAYHYSWNAIDRPGIAGLYLQCKRRPDRENSRTFASRHRLAASNASGGPAPGHSSFVSQAETGSPRNLGSTGAEMDRRALFRHRQAESCSCERATALVGSN